MDVSILGDFELHAARFLDRGSCGAASRGFLRTAAASRSVWPTGANQCQEVCRMRQQLGAGPPTVEAASPRGPYWKLSRGSRPLLILSAQPPTQGGNVEVRFQLSGHRSG